MARISKAQRAEREELAAQGLKRCSSCKEIKGHKEFSKKKATWDRFQSYCRICKSDKAAAYREANPDKVREWQREYREANQDKERDWHRKYREDNLEKERERAHKYNHARRASDPLWDRIHKGAHRARKLGCEVIPFTSKDLLSYWSDNNISLQNCYYCNSELEAGWHTDHMIPLGKGGPHSVENLVPSCAKCNFSKNNKTAEEFSKSISDVS